MQNYKIKDYTVQEFSEIIDVNHSNIYRYLREEKGDIDKVLEKTFKHKFKEDISDKYSVIENYYLIKFMKIKRKKITLNNKNFWKLKEEFNHICYLYKLRAHRIEKIWDNIMSIVYFK